MSKRVPKWLVLSLLSFILGTCGAFTGCKKDEGAAPTASTGNAGNVGGEVASSGRSVFDSNRCSNCHSVNGQGGRGGPDLSHVGSQPGHTTDWLVAHVKNPRAHNPGSRMPSFEGKISDKDLAALGAYLASLK